MGARLALRRAARTPHWSEWRGAGHAESLRLPSHPKPHSLAQFGVPAWLQVVAGDTYDVPAAHLVLPVCEVWPSDPGPVLIDDVDASLGAEEPAVHEDEPDTGLGR